MRRAVVQMTQMKSLFLAACIIGGLSTQIAHAGVFVSPIGPDDPFGIWGYAAAGTTNSDFPGTIEYFAGTEASPFNDMAVAYAGLGFGYHGHSAAVSRLESGTLHAYAQSVSSVFGGAADAWAELRDTIFLSGIESPDPLATTRIGIRLSSHGIVGGDFPQHYFSATVRPLGGTTGSVVGQYNGLNGQLQSGDFGWASSTWTTVHPGLFQGDMFFDVYAGYPSFIIDMALGASAYGTSTAALFHTAGIELFLPEGVSFTSASGVFLSQEEPFIPLPGPIAAVPEPATWAMMLFGFGVIGFGMWRAASQIAPRVNYSLA